MVKIRKAHLQDAADIIRFQQAMAWETEKLELEITTLTKGVEAVFQDPNKGQYWVAEENQVICGCLLTVPEWSDWRNGTVLWIHSVYVLPEYRNKNIFSQLYNNLKEMVTTSTSLRGLRLYVEKSNTHAQNVYKKLGMSPEHYHLYEWLK